MDSSRGSGLLEYCTRLCRRLPATNHNEIIPKTVVGNVKKSI
jgi:hypothetical protein